MIIYTCKTSQHVCCEKAWSSSGDPRIFTSNFNGNLISDRVSLHPIVGQTESDWRCKNRWLDGTLSDKAWLHNQTPKALHFIEPQRVMRQRDCWLQWLWMANQSFTGESSSLSARVFLTHQCSFPTTGILTEHIQQLSTLLTHNSMINNVFKQPRLGTKRWFTCGYFLWVISDADTWLTSC